MVGSSIFGVAQRMRNAIRYSKSRLTDDQKHDLELMRLDNGTASGQYRPGTGRGWEKLVDEFEQTFHSEGIGDVEQQSFNARFAANPPGSRVYYHIACNLMLLRLEQRDKWGIISCLKNTQNIKTRNHEVEIRGLVVSWDLLISIQALISMAEADSRIITESCVVLDLGAGWGRVGHVLLRVNPKSSYICADLPETLLISQNYLPTTLPGIPVRDYRRNREKLAFSEAGLHFIGCHDLPRIPDKSIDYFLNIASFQEMQNKQVEGYLSDIDRVCKGIFYTRQINFTNRKDGFVVDGEEYYPFPPNWQRLYIRDADEWTGYFEAAFRMSGRA